MNLDASLGKFRNRIRQIDDEIKDLIHGQSRGMQTGQKELSEAQVVIKDLFARINAITTKAEYSERMVYEITRDIKCLDFAKRNLTTSITVLKRVHMLGLSDIHEAILNCLPVGQFRLWSS